jgi:hypothetical protein
VPFFSLFPLFLLTVLPSSAGSGGNSNLGYGLGGINGSYAPQLRSRHRCLTSLPHSGQVPDIPNLPTLMDTDTPLDAYSLTGHDGNTYNLVFSDEVR